jgi:hypothetical protein
VDAKKSPLSRRGAVLSQQERAGGLLDAMAKYEATRPCRRHKAQKVQPVGELTSEMIDSILARLKRNLPRLHWPGSRINNISPRTTPKEMEKVIMGLLKMHRSRRLVKLNQRQGKKRGIRQFIVGEWPRFFLFAP